MAEVYDATGGASSAYLINVSIRTQTGAGSNVLTAGFAIGGGATGRTVLIRGVGPTLTDFGVSGVLAMPQLTVFDSGGAVITSNAGWNNDPILASAAQATGAFALDYNTFDSAVLVSLVPGAYTAQVTGTGSTTGVALLEIYEVP